MAFPSVSTVAVGNIYPAGIVSVFAADTSTNKWQTLGAISQGTINIQDMTSPDSMGRNRGKAVSKFTATARVMQTSLTELELLDSICNGTNAFLFKLADWAAIPTAGSSATIGWIKVTAAQVGVTYKIVADGNPDDDRYIELTWTGTFLNTAKDAMVRASIDDDEFASSADSATAPYYAIGVYSAAKDGGSPAYANIKPCGTSTIAHTDTAGGSGQTIGPVTNFKLSIAQLSSPDSIGRNLSSKTLDIACEYDWMSTTASDLVLLDSMPVLSINTVITMTDGLIFTFSDQMGLATNYEITGGMDAIRVIRFTHTGKVLITGLDAIVSA